MPLSTDPDKKREQQRRISEGLRLAWKRRKREAANGVIRQARTGEGKAGPEDSAPDRIDAAELRAGQDVVRPEGSDGPDRARRDSRAEAVQGVSTDCRKEEAAGTLAMEQTGTGRKRRLKKIALYLKYIAHLIEE